MSNLFKTKSYCVYINGAIKYQESVPFRHSGIVNTLTNTDNVSSFSENSSYSDNDTSEFYSDIEHFSIAQFIYYLHVKFHSVQVAALLDSGSSINIMSTSLYNSIPQACKSMIDVNDGDNIIHVTELSSHNWRFGNFQLEFEPHNWRFFIDVHNGFFVCV